MNVLDKAIAAISPTWGLERVKARAIMAAYEGAKDTRTRRLDKASRSSSDDVLAAGRSLREQARHLDQNHDLATGVLDTLVARVVGPSGISIEPTPQTLDGELHEDLAEQIEMLQDEWDEAPEITGTMNRAEMERLACRTWLRDGEVFGVGIRGGTYHNTDIPYSVQLLEPDYCPLDLSDYAPIVGGQIKLKGGIEFNQYLRPVWYYFHPIDPREGYGGISQSDLQRINAQRVTHLKFTRSIRQVRGVTLFANVMTRFQDIKDYEESERVAARIAATLGFYIKKSDQVSGAAQVNENGDREITFAPGMTFDQLMPGEDVGMIESNRPSPIVMDFRNGQLRAIGAGTGAGYSSISKDYSGNYSSQRQELVEQQAHYECFTDRLVNGHTKPHRARMLQMAMLSGRLRIPSDVNPRTIFNAIYYGPRMPWIDPDREAKGAERLVRAGFRTQDETVRQFGGKPRESRKKFAQERRANYANGLAFSSDAANDKGDPADIEESENATE